MVDENHVPHISFEDCGCRNYFVVARAVFTDPEDPNQIEEYYLVECDHYQSHWIDHLTLVGSTEEDC